ncbi:MAG: nitrile hydratase subunit alpha [Chloroflexota bacterium]
MPEDDQGHHSNTDHYAQQVENLIGAVEARGLVARSTVDAIAEELMREDGLAGGAAIVARAWSDAGFRDRLLRDATQAIREIGFEMARGNAPDSLLRVVENTSATHNVIVCTLCSCYPVPILGPPPKWYKDEAYRARVVLEPRAVLGEFGVELPDETEIAVWDSSSEIRYMVLPMRPRGTDDWDEAELATLVTLECLVGTGEPIGAEGVAAAEQR